MKAIFSRVLHAPEMHVRIYVRACLAFLQVDLRAYSLRVITSIRAARELPNER